jgi:putative sterol carrier protein
MMDKAQNKLIPIIEKLNHNSKAQAVFVTNIAGKDIDWEMSFQFNLRNANPFYLEIHNRKTTLINGIKQNAEIIISGDPDAIVKICEGKGDFTHAISREHITVEKGKVMDIIRLTRAITIVLQAK